MLQQRIGTEAPSRAANSNDFRTRFRMRNGDGCGKTSPEAASQRSWRVSRNRRPQLAERLRGAFRLRNGFA